MLIRKYSITAANNIQILSREEKCYKALSKSAAAAIGK